MVVQSCVSANPGLNLGHCFLYFYTYFKTSTTKTTIEPDIAFEEYSDLTLVQAFPHNFMLTQG